MTISGIVAIVGRPNVGKSTLYNALTYTRGSIVSPIPGVTRDRLYGIAYYDRSERTDGFTIIDTGGFETDDFKFQPFAQNLVWQQTKMAIKEADVVVFLFDAKTGLHFHDQEIIQHLEQEKKKVIFVVNKVDGLEQKTLMWDFLSQGLEEKDLVPISAAHRRGLDDLLDAVKDSLEGSRLKHKNDNLTEEECTKIAIIGRPNVGKSSILNRIAGEERSLVSPIAGTTRDSVDTKFIYNKKPYLLIDTAGIRRKTKVSEFLETQSVIRSLAAIDRADIVLFVIDAKEGLTDQDTKLINLTMDRFKPVLLIVNKWDLIPNKTTLTARDYEYSIHHHALKDLAFMPIHFVSCLENQRVHKILALVEDIASQYNKRAKTAQVNEALSDMVQAHSPHLIERSSKRLKFYYATQIESSPPTIILQCNRAEDIKESYKRYMLKCFRQTLGFDKIPLRLVFKNKNEKKTDEKTVRPAIISSGEIRKKVTPEALAKAEALVKEDRVREGRSKQERSIGGRISKRGERPLWKKKKVAT